VWTVALIEERARGAIETSLVAEILGLTLGSALGPGIPNGPTLEPPDGSQLGPYEGPPHGRFLFPCEDTGLPPVLLQELANGLDGMAPGPLMGSTEGPSNTSGGLDPDFERTGPDVKALWPILGSTEGQPNSTGGLHTGDCHKAVLHRGPTNVNLETRVGRRETVGDEFQGMHTGDRTWTSGGSWTYRRQGAKTHASWRPERLRECLDWYWGDFFDRKT
jgi:hypothetical protein